MAASKYDFTIEQGSSYKLSLKYKDNEDNIIPLTNYCARLVWKTNTGVIQTLYSSDPTNNNYKFYLDAANGQINLLFSASYTNSFNFTNAKYDLELQSPQDLYENGGKYTIRVLYGTISISKRFSQTTNPMGCST
jgi:hypothetical protein